MFKTTYDMKFATNSAGSNFNRINSASMSGKQSPKIVSGKYRDFNPKSPFIYDTKEKTDTASGLAYSALDVPIGKLSRGPKVPLQYERKEMERLYSGVEGTVSPVQNIPEEEKKDVSPRVNEDQKEESPQQGRVYSYQRNIKTADVNTRRLHNASKANIDFNKTTDRFLPGNYRDLERQIKTAHAQRDQPQDANEARMPVISVQEIKMKMFESDIFFSKAEIVKKCINNENNPNNRNNTNTQNNTHTQNNTLNNGSNKNKDYQSSDIFMKKGDKANLNKNGEKYLLKNKVIQFGMTSRSNSEWHPKNSYPTLLNHCSTDYHILNPGIKHISKTKDQIAKLSTGFNPVYRQKSICEFIDLTRVGVPNPSKEFLAAYKNKPNAFARDSDLCSTYLDIHRLYRGISEKPFVKNII